MSAGSGELQYWVIFRDFVVHCAVPRDSKLEKRVHKRYLNWGSNRKCTVMQVDGVNNLDFHGFSPIQCFGGKTWPKSYSCYGLPFEEIDFKNTIGRAFHMPWGIAQKSLQKLEI